MHPHPHPPPRLREGDKLLFSYRAFDLVISSEIPLPELTPAKTEAVPDLEIRLRPAAAGVDTRSYYRLIRPLDDGLFLFWDDVGSFLVRGGRTIDVEPRPGVPAETLRLFILGTTLAMLLHQRPGWTILHASAVNVDGRAVAFVGEKGMGKSTISALLNQAGCPLVTDDILAIRPGEQGLQALPAYPHFKLWPDTAAAVGQTAAALPRLRPELDKRGFLSPERFDPRPLPLSHIFVLNQGEAPQITPLPRQEAWQALLPHWYGARFGEEILRHLGLGRHLQECVALANQIHTAELCRPAAAAISPDLAQLVAAYVQTG